MRRLPGFSTYGLSVHIGLTLIFKVVAACLSAVILHQGFLSLDGVQRLARLDGEHMFVNLDSTSDDHVSYLSDRDDSIPAMRNLLDDARSHEGTFSYWEYPDEDLENGSTHFAATTDLNFFETYGLRLKEGTLDHFSPDERSLRSLSWSAPVSQTFTPWAASGPPQITMTAHPSNTRPSQSSKPTRVFHH